jgi:DNA-binding transcriptional ArsR family regulator
MLKQDDKYEKLAGICKALANPVRLKILDVLVSNCDCSKAGCCVNEIISEIELPQPYISKHLKILKDCGILTYRKEANKIYYSFVRNELFAEIIGYLSNCCRQYSADK